MPDAKPNMFPAKKNPAGLLEMLYQSCEQFKNKTAVECGARQISYEDLDQHANRLANCLIARNLTTGSIIAVILSNRLEIIFALIGTLRAGSIFVPLDPDGPETRLRQMIETLTPDCFIVDGDLAESIAEEGAIFGHRVNSATVIRLGGEASVILPQGSEVSLESVSNERPVVSHGPDDMCYVYHTSGSTGVPKGIVGRLKSLTHFVNWEIDTFDLAAGTRVSQLTVPTFDPFLRDVLTPLCVGGTVCIPPDRSTLLEPRLLIDWLDNNRINLVHCVPLLFNAIVHENPDPGKLTTLQFMLMSGESLPVADVRKWIDTYGDRVKLVNLYGPTETTMVKFYHVIERFDLQRGFIPIGKPMRGAKAIVLDPEGNVCPPGVTGELYIRTPYLTHGYYQNPELTKEVFIANPLTNDPADIVYRTGDLARVLSDGNFQFIGRSDNQVKIRGNRVEPGEVESALHHYELIRKAVVTASEELPGGRGLIAYLVAEGGVVLDIGAVRRFLSQRLPDYMMPAAFVQLNEIPLTPNGKVDRRALPAPDIFDELAKQFIPPRNPTEERVAKIWQDVLKVDRVGVFDNFFELGGQSLKATQVMFRTSSAFKIELPLRTIFEAGCVAEMAAIIEDCLINEFEKMSDDEATRLSGASQ